MPSFYAIIARRESFQRWSRADHSTTRSTENIFSRVKVYERYISNGISHFIHSIYWLMESSNELLFVSRSPDTEFSGKIVTTPIYMYVQQVWLYIPCKVEYSILRCWRLCDKITISCHVRNSLSNYYLQPESLPLNFDWRIKIRNNAQYGVWTRIWDRNLISSDSLDASKSLFIKSLLLFSLFADSVEMSWIFISLSKYTWWRLDK